MDDQDNETKVEPLPLPEPPADEPKPLIRPELQAMVEKLRELIQKANERRK